MKRHEHALVVGKFAPLHRGHQLLIDEADALARRLTLVTWANPDFEDMPGTVRAAWLRELWPHATVLQPQDAPADAAADSEHRRFVRDLLRAHGLRPDVVVSSEAYGDALAAELGARHHLVDRARVRVPVSGTLVRSDVHAHRALLDPRVYRHFVERVVLLGAESTGKSTLAAALAERLGTTFVPEYGRTHYESRGGVLDLEDYVEIARRHRELEDEAALRAHRWLVVDTNALTTMFFSHYYERASLPELRRLAGECRERYAHVIACDDDIPFEQDGWRDRAAWRARMQGMVLHDLAVRGIPWRTVGGSLAERVERCVEILEGRAPPEPPPRAARLGPRPGAE